MTAQIPDHVMFEDERYDLGGASNGPLFSPGDWGVETESRWSANWRGYTVGYGVINEELYITYIYLNSTDGIYPVIGGVTPEDGMYKNLKMKLPYDGKIRLVKDFNRHYYVHVGFQATAAHDTVLELTFDKGQLVEIRDRSEEAKRLREEYDKGHERSPWSLLDKAWEDFSKLFMKFD